MEVGEVLNLHDAEDVADAAGFELLDWEWRWEGGDEHVGLGEGLEDVLRDCLFPLPVEGMLC